MPVGYLDQQDFLNAVIALHCDDDPPELFTRLKELEKELGRKPRERWHEREIDLDILFFDDLVSRNEYLTIPHPEALRRNFVLIPLTEIAPNLHDPASGRLIADIAKDLVTTSDEIRKLPDDEIVL
jgi:2-amino-4-hydroxy-6-hydroxymethyldihydropteridine diphosphokinase